MNNVIWGQYDSKCYPLKYFYYKDIPKKIEKLLMQLCQCGLAIFRGGLAFVYLLNRSDYQLKDLDMLADADNLNLILDCLSEANVIYVNKNTFGESVITAFWEDEQEYYKLDILLSCKMPGVTKTTFENQSVVTVSASYIWKNRFEKIAEKEIRNHDNKKTLNHYNVAIALSQYLLEHKAEINEEDKGIIESRLDEVKTVLLSMIPETDANKFIEMQLKLVGS